MELFIFCIPLSLILLVVGSIKGFRVLLGFIIASCAVLPMFLLMRTIFLNAYEYSSSHGELPLDIMQFIPGNFWIYLIPAFVFIIGTFIYRHVMEKKYRHEADEEKAEDDHE